MKQLSFMRIFRLALGAMIVGEGLHSGDSLLIVLGGVLIVQGILNMGCGFGNTFTVHSDPKVEQEISYEKIDP